MFGAKLTWEYFVNALKEQYYPIGNYDDRYIGWTTLCQGSSKQHLSTLTTSIPCL